MIVRKNLRSIWQGINPWAQMKKQNEGDGLFFSLFFGRRRCFFDPSNIHEWLLGTRGQYGGYAVVKIWWMGLHLLEFILLPFSLLKLGDNLEGVIVTLGFISAPAALLLFNFSFIVAIARIVAMFWDSPVCNRKTCTLFGGVSYSKSNSTKMLIFWFDWKKKKSRLPFWNIF